MPDKNPYVRTAALDKCPLREMFPPVHVPLLSVRSFRVKINNLELNLRSLALYEVLFSLLKLKNLTVEHWIHQINMDFVVAHCYLKEPISNPYFSRFVQSNLDQ